MSKTFQEQWPLWPPSYESPLQLVDIRVKLPVDELFELLYAPGSEYVARSQEVRGNKDYVESPWLASAEELSALPHLPPPVPKELQGHARDPAEYKGLLRKTSCSSFGMGMKFRTDEVHRCLEAQSGSSYEVEVCVATTATYGEKFRGVCRHRLKADGPQWSTWKADFALVYVAPVNGLLKKAIERGSAGGLAKNFATLVEILGEFGEVRKPQQEQEQEAAPGAPPELAQQQAQARVLGVLDEGFVRLFEPLAATVLRAGRAGTQQGAAAQEVSRTATAIAVVVLLVMLQCLLAIVRMALGSFRINPGWLGIPGSVSGVVFSIAVFVLAQRGLPLVAAGLPSLFGRLPGVQKLRRSSRSMSSGADADAPAKGTRFEGFDAALESANAEITSGEQELRAASLANLALQRTAPAREQLRTGVKGFQKLMADTWTAGRRRMANGALTPERAISPVRQQGIDKRLGTSRGSSPLPTSPKSEIEDANALSDDALQRRSPSARRRHGNRRPEKALMKSFNAASRSSGDEAEAQRSVEMSAMGPRPASLTSQTSSLSEYEGAGPVEAEVFENERFLPFRGWGHQWPGHLLPTDRVGHWSLRGDGPSGAESMDFHNVAPSLREGWEWLEEDWHIDMTGHEEGCVDDEGWYYAVDFNWLKHPPQPGAGRFKRVRDYVRRRRWVRTRVRCEAMMATNGALQRLASLSQPPPLLPLTELLGDLAITPETQPLPQGPTASPEAEAAAERLPFELRPAGTSRTSAELQTPRLVMRSGQEQSPSSGAEEGPVQLHLSVAPHDNATEEASRVIVRLTLRQEQAAPVGHPSSSQRAVQQPVPASDGSTQATQLAPSGSAAQAGEQRTSVVPADCPSPAGEEDHARIPPGQPAVSTPGDDGAIRGAESLPEQARVPAEAEDSGGTGDPSQHVADPFAAVANPPAAQGSGDMSPPSAAAVRSGKEAAAADGAGGLLDSDLEQLELQIAASMQPSTEGSGAAERLHACASQHSSRATQSGFEDAVSPCPAKEGASSDKEGDRVSRQVSEWPALEGIEETDAKSDADAAQQTSVTEQGHATRVDSTAAPAEVLNLPKPSLPASDAPGIVSQEVPAQRGSERTREEEAAGAQSPASSPSQEHAAKEHADWEHVRSGSDGDTDDSGVVVQHEHASQTDHDAVVPVTSGVPALQGVGQLPHRIMADGSSESADQPLDKRPPAMAQRHEESDAAMHGSDQDQEAPTQPSSSSPAAQGSSSSAVTSAGDTDRHGTPERRLLFPRPAGESSPGLSPGAVDWSQIGKKSGRLAAMAGDSLRKGFAQAASHASSAARQSGKGEPKALSPPAEKPQDHPSRPSNTPPGREQQAGGPSFLQTLKSRGEQSLHAARSVLSPEATGHRPDGAAGGDTGAAAAEGPKGEHAGMGSMRGMFSDLKRTMERVGHSAPLMNMASFGKQDAVLLLPGTSSEAEDHMGDQLHSTNVTNESDTCGQVDYDLARPAQLSTGQRQHAGKLKES